MLGTIITLAANIPASYALSRKKLYGKKLFNMFYLIPMFFTGGLIPTYMVDVYKRQLHNVLQIVSVFRNNQKYDRNQLVHDCRYVPIANHYGTDGESNPLNEV